MDGQSQRFSLENVVTIPVILFRVKYMEVLHIILIWRSAAIAAAADRNAEMDVKIRIVSF